MNTLGTLRASEGHGPRPATGAAPVVITLVHTDACHLCDDAARALALFTGPPALHVEQVAADSPRGTELVQQHRAGLFPLILVDGEYFGAGRLSRAKLRRLLDRKVAAAADVS